MTTDNSTTNTSTTLTPKQIKKITGDICNLAKSAEDMLDDGIGGHVEVTSAQLVAMKTMVTNIGALADHMNGGTYLGGPLDWMGVT